MNREDVKVQLDLIAAKAKQIQNHFDNRILDFDLVSSELDQLSGIINTTQRMYKKHYQL